MATDNPEISIRELAIATLRAVASDANAPAAARAQSARTLLELDGSIGKGSETKGELETRDLATLSPGELDAEIARLERETRTPGRSRK